MAWWNAEQEEAPAAVDRLAHLPHGPVAAARKFQIIFGAPGEGKTYHAATVHRAAVERGASATWIDPTGDNLYVARAGRERGTLCAVVSTPEGWAAHVLEAARAGRPYNIVVANEGRSLDRLWSLMARAGNCLLSLDEADTLAPPGAAEKLLPLPLGKLLARSRNRQLNVQAVVRAPPELNQAFKTWATEVITFRQANEDHAQLIAQRYFQRAHPRARELIMRLPKYRYLRYSPASGRLEIGGPPSTGA